MVDEARAAPLYDWIVNHDDRKSFVILYILLAVLLSAFVSLFWLCFVVGVHYTFELIIQRDQGKPWRPAMAAALWEIKLDSALILFAFVIDVYMGVILGVVGISAGARVAATAGARFAGWQRMLRIVLISLDDLAQAFKAIGRALTRRANRPATPTPLPDEPTPDAAPTPETRVQGRLAVGDILSLSFGAICAALLLLAPLLTDHTPSEVLGIIISELRPLP